MSNPAEKRKTALILIIILCAVTLAVIWGFSMRSIPESRAQSRGVMETIRPILEMFVGEGNVTDHLVRKLAHFAEFALFGGELALLLMLRQRVRLQSVVNCLLAGFAVAAFDETIQIFSARGPMVQDIWLDLAGFCAGLAFVLLLRHIVLARRKRRSEAEPDA